MLKNISFSVVSPSAQRQEYIYAKGDSAASDHYFRPEDSACLEDITTTASHQPITLPNKKQIYATDQGILPLSNNISKQGRTAKILPELKSASLISIGKLCDDDCQVYFDKRNLQVRKNNKLILQGKRNYKDGLYDIPIAKKVLHADNYNEPIKHPSLYQTRIIPSPQQHKQIRQPKRKSLLHEAFPALHMLANENDFDNVVAKQKIQDCKAYHIVEKIRSHPSLAVIIRKQQTKHDLIKYLHAACFSPTNATWIRAVKNNHFNTWPGLTIDLIKNHLPKSIATIQGHMKKEQQGLQSTTQRSTKTDNIESIRKRYEKLKQTKKEGESFEDTLTRDMMEDAFPMSPSPNKKCNEVAYAVINPKAMSNAYCDLTGRFPQRATSGNQYIMIGYHYDANSILAEPLKNRTAGNIVEVWKKLHQRYENAAVTPDIYIMDNEFSQELRAAL